MTGMLASVNSLQEARWALAAEVDIIDLKQPALGALGALPVTEVAHIVKHIQGQKPVSATIGDLPMHTDLIYNAVQAMAGTGVNYVKIGFFPNGDTLGCLEKLSGLTAQGVKLIAVLFADAKPDIKLIPAIAKAGFSGVMLDTIDKNNGSLTQLMHAPELADFVYSVKQQQLLCGLAGSLTMQDIPVLIKHPVDYLGFRGALCTQQQRTATLDQAALVNIKSALKKI